MAGQKMRKWYGAPERTSREKKSAGDDQPPENGQEEEEEPSEPTVNDAVLVTDADTPLGEQVILRLILDRVRVKAIVSDTARAKSSYGDFIEPVSVDIGSQNAAKSALKGCAAVISLGRIGGLERAIASRADSIHLILLSTSNVLSSANKMPWSSLFKPSVSGVGQLNDDSREVQARRSEFCTVIKVDPSSLSEVQGGKSALAFISSNKETSGDWASELGNEVSCEDLAAVLVASLQHLPSAGDARTFQVVSKGKGGLPSGSDWEAMFNAVSN